MGADVSWELKISGVIPAFHRPRGSSGGFFGGRCEFQHKRGFLAPFSPEDPLHAPRHGVDQLQTEASATGGVEPGRQSAAGISHPQGIPLPGPLEGHLDPALSVAQAVTQGIVDQLAGDQGDRHDVVHAPADVLALDLNGAVAARGAHCGIGDVAEVLGEIDLGNEAAVMSAYARVAETLGSIDALVNIAGGFVWEPIDGGTLDSWDRMYGINLRTAVVSTRSALPHLLKSGGAVVNIGANAATQPGTGMAPYAASKSGVRALTAEMLDGRRPIDFTLWRIVNLGIWGERFGVGL